MDAREHADVVRQTLAFAAGRLHSDSTFDKWPQAYAALDALVARVEELEREARRATALTFAIEHGLAILASPDMVRDIQSPERLRAEAAEARVATLGAALRETTCSRAIAGAPVCGTDPEADAQLGLCLRCEALEGSHDR